MKPKTRFLIEWECREYIETALGHTYGDKNMTFPHKIQNCMAWTTARGELYAYAESATAAVRSFKRSCMKGRAKVRATPA